MSWLKYFLIISIGIFISSGLISSESISTRRNNILINQNNVNYNGNYKVLYKINNESLYNINFRKIPIIENKIIVRYDTEICMVANFSSKEISFGNFYNVPEKLSLYKEGNNIKDRDLNRTLIKLNPLSPTPNDFEIGDNYTFCYQANPEKDFYLKFGDDSIIVIQEQDIYPRSFYKNTTYDLTTMK